jgi:hypothetical protein
VSETRKRLNNTGYCDHMMYKMGLIAHNEKCEWDFMDREATILQYDNPNMYYGKDSDSGENAEEK